MNGKLIIGKIAVARVLPYLNIKPAADFGNLVIRFRHMRIKEHFNGANMQLYEIAGKDKKSLAHLQGLNGFY